VGRKKHRGRGARLRSVGVSATKKAIVLDRRPICTSYGVRPKTSGMSNSRRRQRKNLKEGTSMSWLGTMKSQKGGDENRYSKCECIKGYRGLQRRMMTEIQGGGERGEEGRSAVTNRESIESMDVRKKKRCSRGSKCLLPRVGWSRKGRGEIRERWELGQDRHAERESIAGHAVR